MSQKNKNGLIFLGGLVIGAAASWGASWFIRNKKGIHGDDILIRVKNMFLKEGPIEGSWIELKKVPFNKYALHTDIYYGGITRKENDELVQYEFYADAYTGAVLDLYRL
ncbi:PepSY domain-containing protein [Isobaculum melis]|uniref:Predicted small secreted protein n=1 Tax=Isobaculum melis TaxID=142588 RepID=A0A1H9S7K9_9LACT|nr:PepSY domain-containing protein [Isobaculum melis]SER80908.1 Predicted small secreted protein [Isobaculum melis]